ncbi:Arc family DNA-binding protein [Rhizobium hidalgonense]|uniref:Arc family DNA-binding protein n=1 Tax=Rhizobium hidalgonense TaxID=1538159 RepID=A0AAJ2LJA6_9HYPH|nr:Arc family DNA-binding protein [Rhizobium hidalgonense]MDR9774120.1 Arc family DNA-binding protein [Rhizobium hidalgonense]MDR9820593.1 Arc family DNA-binding protein [Rhizobium hidalgonense]
MKKIAQPQEKYVLRLPDGMRDRLKAAANLSGRSMNAEFVHRVEQSFAQSGDATVRTVIREMLGIIVEERAALREELRTRLAAEIAARPNDSPIDIINEILDSSHDRKMDLERYGASVKNLRKIAEYMQEPEEKDGADK